MSPRVLLLAVLVVLAISAVVATPLHAVKHVAKSAAAHHSNTPHAVIPPAHKLSHRVRHIQKKSLPVAAPLDATATGKIFLGSAGLDLFQNIINQVMEADLQNMPLPDETIKVKHGHVDLKNMVISNVEFTTQNVALNAPNSAAITWDNFQGEFNVDYHYKGPLGIHVSGHMKCEFKDTSIDAALTFGATSAGSPNIVLNAFNVHINDLDIHVSGGVLGWLTNLLVDLFKHRIRETIQSKVQSTGQAKFEAVLARITTAYPLVMQLTGGLAGTNANLGLVGFSTANGYLAAEGDWSFQSSNGGAIDPRPRDPIESVMPLNPQGQAPMFGIAMDEYFMGSLLYSLMQQGRFNFHYENADLPPGSKWDLDTKLLELVYPKLYAAYPNSDISVDILPYNNIPPTIGTSPSGTSIQSQMTLTINILSSTGAPPDPQCTLLLDLGLDVAFDFINESPSSFSLSGNISPFVFSATVLTSKIDPGSFAPNAATFVQDLVDALVVPSLNKALSAGIPIPAAFGTALHLQNVFVNYGSHVLTLGFDMAVGAAETTAIAEKVDEWVSEP